MAKLLAKFTIADDGPNARELAHAEQARLASLGNRTAECREDPHAGEYSVWDGAAADVRDGQVPG